MSYTTIGIHLEPHAIRYAQCQVNQSDVSVELFEEIACETADAESLDEGLRDLTVKLLQNKNRQIDGIGLTLDSSCALSAHRTLPFNDPKIVAQILPQSLMDIWKIDDTTQISFEVGAFVSAENKGEGTEGESEAQSGYDIHAICYPRERLAALLDRFHAAQIDPHVAIPTVDAFRYIASQMECPTGSCAVLNLGEESTDFYVVSEGEVRLERSMKTGLCEMDASIADAFGIEENMAKDLRRASGFVAEVGQEVAIYSRLVSSRRIEECQRPDLLSQACARGMQVLVAALFQTIGNYARQTNDEPSCVYLTGKGAEFPGLAEWLSRVCGGPCRVGLPLHIQPGHRDQVAMRPDSVSAALAAAANLDGLCQLNLRHGALAHKGSLAYLKDHKWLLGALVIILLGVLIFSRISYSKAVQEEHDRLRTALENATQAVFDRKIMKYNEIVAEVEGSSGFDLIPEKTAFSHFIWLSSAINDNLTDVEMDMQSLDIDTQRKIVTIRADVVGNEGLPRFMQLLETYECFPNEIPEPKTTKNKDKTSFTLRIDANQCKTTGEDSE